jgi:cytochrome c oxidase assembly protein subunit 15
MDAQPLYDLAPAARLMLMGVVIALGPLAWVWLRNRDAEPARRLRTLTLLTLFLTFDLVLFGAFTRLTDSGLGCPDWPGCYGNASPVGARAEIHRGANAMPTGPVTHGKAWIEMIHRYLATGVGVLILTLAVTTWLQWRRPGRAVCRVRARGGPRSRWSGSACRARLAPDGHHEAVSRHRHAAPDGWRGAAGPAVRAGRAPCRPAEASRPCRCRDHALGLLAVTAAGGLQVACWAAGSAPITRCWPATTFPTCQGSWWPVMDFAQGFELWRELGKTAAGEHISFAAPDRHPLCAPLALWWFWWRWLAGHGACAVPCAALAGALACGLALLQLATGLSNVVLDWPLLAAVGTRAALPPWWWC